MLTLGAAGAGGSMGLMIFVVIMFVGMYFLSIRPQKKQQQKRKEMLSAMNKGDRVVTLGGIKGVVASINRENKEVVVDCDGIYLTFDLNFIRRAEPAATKTTDAKVADDAETKNVEATDDTKAEDAKDVEPKAGETEVTAEKTETEAPKAEDAAKDDTKEETK